ncbi:MAG: hypothetical protein Ct9H300mP29_8010 [Candidatus Neomarinimicrobiota bacterium]|nr:MAG: hypothetical protein Ct9H300mP29_8010 [Candidatus Neomarinimicrobiota bacterium]
MGICVAACPSAGFMISVREFLPGFMGREDIDTFYELLNDSYGIAQNVFPVPVVPGKTILEHFTIMREVAVNHGLSSAKKALRHKPNIYK